MQTLAQKLKQWLLSITAEDIIAFVYIALVVALFTAWFIAEYDNSLLQQRLYQCNGSYY